MVVLNTLHKPCYIHLCSNYQKMCALNDVSIPIINIFKGTVSKTRKSSILTILHYIKCSYLLQDLLWVKQGSINP